MRADAAGTERTVLTVQQLNETVSAAVDAAFPGTVWVRGEVQRLAADAARRQHVYFELHEAGKGAAAEYQIPAALMGWDRQRFGLGRYLDGGDPDFQLANKLEVCLECKVDFYAKFGKLSLKVVGVDKHFSLGKLEARRREILAYLKLHELLERNAAVPWPDLPLNVGLITAAGSAAEWDFLTGLEASPWPFRVNRTSARMQGESLQAEVLKALAVQVAAGVEVIVLTRGGGSRADLSWFDQRGLAVAIAECPVPVVTAIGHEIDRSIADEVAARSCKTPTAAAEFLVDHVDVAARRLAEVASGLVEIVRVLLAEARRRTEVEERLAQAAGRALLVGRSRAQGAAARLQQRVAGRLEGQRRVLAGLGVRLGAGSATAASRFRERLAGQSLRLTGAARGRLERATGILATQGGRLVRGGPRLLGLRRRELDGLAAQVRLQDPVRLLARGYTMTFDEKGALLKEAGPIRPGSRLTTRFADGEVGSIVESAPGGVPSGGNQSKIRKGKGSGPEEGDTGQKTLFR